MKAEGGLEMNAVTPFTVCASKVLRKMIDACLE